MDGPIIGGPYKQQFTRVAQGVNIQFSYLSRVSLSWRQVEFMTSFLIPLIFIGIFVLSEIEIPLFNELGCNVDLMHVPQVEAVGYTLRWRVSQSCRVLTCLNVSGLTGFTGLMPK